MDSSFRMLDLKNELSKIKNENKIKKAFFDAANSGNTRSVLSMLVEAPQLLEARTQEGDTALMLAAKNNHFETVENLLKMDAQIIDLENKNGDTALMFAAGHGHTKIVDHLIANNANILSANKQGDNALTLAAKKNQDTIVFQLMGGISPYHLSSLKQIAELKPFVMGFELETRIQGKRMASPDLAIALEFATENELWEKPKKRARKKRDLAPLVPASTSSSDSKFPPKFSYNTHDADADAEKPFFKKSDGRTDSKSWRNGASSLTFVAPVAVKKLDPRVADFMPESPSSKFKKVYDLNFPPLSIPETDSWRKDPALHIKFR